MKLGYIIENMHSKYQLIVAFLKQFLPRLDLEKIAFI